MYLIKKIMELLLNTNILRKRFSAFINIEKTLLIKNKPAVLI